MKKFLSLLLCIVLSGLMLVACADEEIGDYLPNYDYTPEVIEDLSLNMYIITDDATTKNAKDTVAQMINSYTTTQFHTYLNVYYLTAAEYDAQIKGKVNATDASAANIVLINNKALADDLISAGKLADLTAYLDSDKYGTLNVQITEALLEGSKVQDKYYAIPNNRVVGQYDYLVISKEMARDILNYSPSKLDSYKTLDDAAPLVAKIDEYLAANPDKYPGATSSQFVYTTSGLYELKASLEADGNYCNIMTYPTVTAEVAFSSAFAVVNREEKFNERSMEIIYAINTDTYLRNLLQYGVKGTNYSENTETGEIIRVSQGDNLYGMNLLYTGDVFKAYYCSELGWTKSVAENGALQNAEAIAK